MNDKTYLTNYDINEALDIYTKLLNIKESTEEAETKDSLGRISSEGVYAKISNPFSETESFLWIFCNFFVSFFGIIAKLFFFLLLL